MASFGCMQLKCSSFSGTSLSTNSTQQRLSIRSPMQIQAAQTLQGKVVSKKTEKTVVVAVEQLVKHRIYGKRMRQTHRIFAHDEAEIASFGDTIRISACAPHSKMKRFNVESIVKQFAIPGLEVAK